MLMPMIYKMGVMMTMLMVIAAISAKGLLIGKHYFCTFIPSEKCHPHKCITVSLSYGQRNPHT